MGNGYTGVGGGCDAARHAGDHLERQSGFDQGERLLPAAPEDVGVAALQAHDRLPGVAELYQEVVDLLLGHGGVARLLADVDFLRLGPRVP